MSSRVSWLNAVDAAVFSGTSSFSTLPIQNIASYIIKKLWRTTTIVDFTITFASVTDVDVLALAGCTAGSGDTIRHRLYDASNNLLHDSGVIDINIATGYGKHFYFPSSTIAAVKKWVCNIDAHASLGYSPPDGSAYLDIGRAWAGPAWMPSIGFGIGAAESYDNNFGGKRGTKSGIYFPGDGDQWQTSAVKFSWLSDSDRAEAREFLRQCTPQDQMVFVPDVDGDPSREGIIGRVTSVPIITQEVAVYPAAYTFTLNLSQDV